MAHTSLTPELYFTDSVHRSPPPPPPPPPSPVFRCLRPSQIKTNFTASGCADHIPGLKKSNNFKDTQPSNTWWASEAETKPKFHNGITRFYSKSDEKLWKHELFLFRIVCSFTSPYCHNIHKFQMTKYVY